MKEKRRPSLQIVMVSNGVKATRRDCDDGEEKSVTMGSERDGDEGGCRRESKMCRVLDIDAS